MQAKEANLLWFLGQRHQLVIPIYQRAYSWELAQCQQLWRDILRVGRDTTASAHFIGSVVYIARSHYFASLINQLLVIDGQQRLTTISLLLAALARAISKRSLDIGISREKLENYYLFNSQEEADMRYKLLLTKSDKETLKCIIDGNATQQNGASARILENFAFFEELIARMSDDDVHAVYAGLQKLLIVDISLDRDHDNPQLIFESLNATALKLTESDLIRNYVLMGLDAKDQAELYEKHWYPIEQGFLNSGWFDWFVRDYLTVKTGTIPNIRDVYATFKSFVTSPRNQLTIPEIVADMHRFAGYFARMTQEHPEPDADLRAAFHDLNTLRVDVARPYLLRLYEDYDKGVVDKKTVLDVLRLIESYVFRRAICGIPTNSLNKTFAGLDREIIPSDYLNSLKAAMLLKDSYRRFPTDQEFKQELKVRDVYNMRIRNYLLARLENEGRKESVVLESYTIEHILPQNANLRPEWRTVLGANWKEVQQRLLHTLGNLTLTGYNSEYSDRPFPEKRDMEGGFRESPLRLNQGIGQLSDWNEAEILSRADRLAMKALEIWQFPDLPDADLARYTAASSQRNGNVSLDDFPSLTGNNLVLFNELRKRLENLDASVAMIPRKQFIGFDAATNFVGVIPYKSAMRVVFNVKSGQILDHKGMCKDISGIGHWANGDLELANHYSDLSQLDDIVDLARQAYEATSFEIDDPYSSPEPVTGLLSIGRF